MEALLFIKQFVGPTFYALLPLSVITWGLVIYTVYSICRKRDTNEWIEVLLAHIKEVSTLIGLLGSVYALAMSFDVEGTSPEQIRENMFLILSTGFWSTIAGVVVSIEAGIGLLVMKKS